MPLVLTPRVRADSGPLSLDVEGMVPERLAGLPADAVRRLEVLADGRPCGLGDIFSVAGSADDMAVEWAGDCGRVHRVGAGMRAGVVRVRGSVGRHAGAGMAGGRLEVGGDAGDWLAAGMTGGEVLVDGAAGDGVAAALPGDDIGMNGGIVAVNGAAGCLAGARMRRGLVGIGGGCGEAAAFEMRAGTVVVAGPVGRRSGTGMRRGSLVALSAAPAVPATFCRGAAWSPTVLPLLAARLARAGFRATQGRQPDAFGGVWQHWHGDLLCGGRGEIFHRP